MNIYLSFLLLMNLFSMSMSYESGSGLLVAGGFDLYSGSLLDLVEVIDLETLTSCIVDVPMDQPRYLHTGDGDLVCGGYDFTSFLNTCYNIVTGATINLNNVRSNHVSWSRASGEEIYLIGGLDGSGYRTSELITGESTEAAFELQYDIV